MSEVNQHNMALWIVALRSGKYKQAHGGLRRGDAFCCLGVACDVSGLGTWGGGFSQDYVTPRHFDAYGFPRDVAEFFLGESAPSNPVISEDETKRLTCIVANDIAIWLNDQIADALESRYLPNTTAEKVLEEK